MSKEYVVKVLLDLDIVANGPMEAQEKAREEIAGDKRKVTKVDAHSAKELSHAILERIRGLVKDQMGKLCETQEPLKVILSNIDEFETSDAFSYIVEVTVLTEVVASNKKEALHKADVELEGLGRVVLETTIEESKREY